MPIYKLDITWTSIAAGGWANKANILTRRADAITVARGVPGVRGPVTGPGGGRIDDYIFNTPFGAIWIVEGAPGDVDAMIALWEGHGMASVRKSDFPHAFNTAGLPVTPGPPFTPAQIDAMIRWHTHGT